jgi:hypothetical protein
MTNANMQLVVISVLLDDKLETPKPNLDSGEYIVTKIVEISKLSAELEGENRFLLIYLIVIDTYLQNTTERYIIDHGWVLTDRVNRDSSLMPVSHILPLACSWHSNYRFRADEETTMED